ncbi:hypothetical protein KP509_07G020800 [Ceratopteris richardii]|uniref:Uncharacterized protein n=1 Tax=Ceratopteris richardii TaxID=49495 RepID=A0A8T2UFW5_CERRI|nr:hypothetical protein KP509_07G020800 [Ceratopteris richardii]
MASFTLAAPAGTLAASSASLSGLKLSAPTARTSGAVKVAVVPVRASASPKSEVEKDREIMKRRALVFGVFASAVLVASNMQNESAIAETDPRKKRNKCPTICVQNPTASCCFSY